MLKQKLLKVSTLSQATLMTLAIAILGGCQTDQPTASVAPPVSKPLVVATSDVICDLTKQIAADTIDLKCLIEPGTDPHTYKATPEDIKAIANSKLILFSGYDFEPTLIKAIRADTGSARKVAVAEIAVPKPIMGEGHDHHDEDHDHKEDKAESEKPEPDPHVWHNAENGLKMAEAIVSELKQLQPDQAEIYEQNSQKLTTEVKAIDNWIKAQIVTIPTAQRKLVTTHGALGYYAQAYKIPIEGALQGLSTEEKTTPTRVKALILTIKDSKVPTIFTESSINPKLMETISTEAKVKVSTQPLFADGLGAFGSNADTYQKMLIANTKAIVEGLGGKIIPIQ